MLAVEHHTRRVPPVGIEPTPRWVKARSTANYRTEANEQITFATRFSSRIDHLLVRNSGSAGIRTQIARGKNSAD